MPRSVLEAGHGGSSRDSSDNPFAGVEQRRRPAVRHPRRARSRPGSTAPSYADAKMAALRAHATQIPPTSWLYAIAGNFGGEFMGVEYYPLARGEQGPGAGPYGWEDDLFAGLPAEPARTGPRSRRPAPVTLPAAPMSVVAEPDAAAHRPGRPPPTRVRLAGGWSVAMVRRASPGWSSGRAGAVAGARSGVGGRWSGRAGARLAVRAGDHRCCWFAYRRPAAAGRRRCPPPPGA